MSSARRLDNLIRKLRKKLRQIENLERLNRTLTDEESIKLNSKDEVRETLQTALDEYQEADNDVESTSSESHSNVSEGRHPESEVHSPESESVDRSSVADPSWHGHLKETDQLNKHSVPASVTIASTETRNRKQELGRGDGKKQESKVKKVKPQFSELFCQVSYLEGHNDLITSLVVIGDKVVTASRDTTLKYWDITQGTEIRSYGGHTETVTSLLVLEHAYEPALPENDKLLVSGSLDSTFKLWALNSGQLQRSVYTYNPVVHIAFCFPASRLVTGSDGGKLELWNLTSGENSFSSRVHNASVTGLKVSENTVYSSASDGVIKIHQVTEGGQMACVFVSETVKTSSGSPLINRHIRCLAVRPDIVFFGEDAKNVKILDWKKGLVTKVPNHTNNFTSTDALSCHGDFLLSSSYDLDQGLGYINVRSSQTLQYMASIDDKSTERIVCLDFGHSSSNNLFVVTGGMDLKVWQVLPAQSVDLSDELDNDDIFKLEFRSTLARSAVDSETESSSGDDSDDECDDDSIQRSRKSDKVRPDISGSGWLSWCSVL